jgi:hypothetical protein
MTRILLAAIALLSAAACTSPGAPASQQASANTKNCIEPARIRQQEVISNDEIRFTLAGGEVWSSKLPRTCPGLKTQGGFSWDVSTTICGGIQSIYVLESGTPCQLGEFTRVSTPTTAG